MCLKLEIFSPYLAYKEHLAIFGVHIFIIVQSLPFLDSM